MKTQARRHIGALVSLFVAISGLSLVTVNAPLVSAAPVSIDTDDPASVRDAYLNVFRPTQLVNNGWTGNVASCLPGDPSPAARDATLTAVNYYRALAGLESITSHSAADTEAQQAALIFTAQNNISHTPAKTWKCWTQAGYNSAGKSNIALGFPRGTEAIPAYMSDIGIPSVGHRSWILYPPQSQMGVGIAGTGSALQWGGFSGMQTNSRPSRGIAWPAEGFFPWENLPNNDVNYGSIPSFSYWSYSRYGKNFSTAKVSVTKNGVAVAISGKSSYGKVGWQPDPVLVWKMPKLTAPAPGTYDTYTVKITGPVSVTYSVKVFLANDPTYNPTQASPGLMFLSGNSTVGQSLSLQLEGSTRPVTGATITQQWLRDGGPISGETGTSYSLDWADICHTVRVDVTTSGGGLTTSTVQSPGKAIRFSDVATSHANYNNICQIAQYGVIRYHTVAKTTFAPAKSMLRAATAAALYRLAGEPDYAAPIKTRFADVKVSHADYKAINWAYDNNLLSVTKKKGKLYFRPAKVTTRSALATAMYRLSGSPDFVPPVKSPFADLKTTASTYKAITWAYSQNGLISGITSKGKLYYKPSKAATRTIAATFFARSVTKQLYCEAWVTGIDC